MHIMSEDIAVILVIPEIEEDDTYNALKMALNWLVNVPDDHIIHQCIFIECKVMRYFKMKTLRGVITEI